MSVKNKVICSVPDGNAVLLVCLIELNPVTLQLDLNNLFQLDNLVLSFKVCYILQSQLDHMNLIMNHY